MKRKYLILFSLSGLIVSLDQVTKHWMIMRLVPEEKSVLWSPFLTLMLSHNNGFAFGLLRKAPLAIQEIFFIGIPVFALILIVLIFIKLQDNQMLTSVALTTILGGAVGNLIDRLQYNYVIDFLDMRLGFLQLPAFNIADCSIIIGVIIMFVNTLFHERFTPNGA